MEADSYSSFTKAEKKLIEHVKKNNNSPLVISSFQPPRCKPSFLTIRANLIVRILLGELEGVPSLRHRLYIEGAAIVGEINLSGKTVDVEVAFRRCTFHAPLTLYRSSFQSIFIDQCSLLYGMRADGIKINNDLYIIGTLSRLQVSLIGGSIEGILNCSNSIFLGNNCSFLADRLDVRGSISFKNVISNSSISFVSAKSGDNFTTSHSNLGSLDYGEMYLSLAADRMEVRGNVFMDWISADGGFSFAGSHFTGDLSFIGSKIHGKTTLICQAAHIEKTWFFINVECEGVVDLAGAQLGHICDRPSSWPPELRINDMKYHSFIGHGRPSDALSRLDWLSRMKPEVYGDIFWPQPYEECARVLRESGDEDGARLILIEKEKLQKKAVSRDLCNKIEKEENVYDRLNLELRLIFKNFIEIPGAALIGYGHRPLLAILPILMLIFLGAIIFLFVDNAGAMTPNHPDVLFSKVWTDCYENAVVGRKNIHSEKISQLSCFMHSPEGKNYPQFSSLAYSIDAFLPIVSFDMQTYWAPDNRLPWGRFGALYLWLHVLLGWALSLLAVAGFSGLVKTGSSPSS